ncbi:MAG TPA: hypothetical protein VGE52_13500 [Pirellulales bacterium]
MLLNMGNPLDVHSGDDEFLRVLLDLTEGDPLIVRLYVEDLWRTAQGGVAIAGPQALVQAARSGGVRRGLAGYFDRWWDDQQRLWELHSDAAARIGRATRLSDVLSAALGPLTAEDLAQLLGKYRPLQDEHLDSRMILRQWIPDFRRFLTGDGDAIGFSLSHPRLKEHFWGSDVKPEARRRQADLQFAFVAWGDEAIWGEKSQLLPQPTPNRRPDSTSIGAPHIVHDLPEPAAPILSDVPRYLVLHYGEHLVAYPHFTDPQLLPRLTRLLDADWCEAWQHATSRHDYAGFHGGAATQRSGLERQPPKPSALSRVRT